MGVSPIRFLTDSIDFHLDDELSISAWLKEIASQESSFIGRLVFHFCTDDELLKINQKHLDHDFYTDVITFDNSRHPVLNGDVFISIDRVNDNAQSQDADKQRELMRVMAHGLLHLIGYGDKSEQEIRVMREKEEWCLSIL